MDRATKAIRGLFKLYRGCAHTRPVAWVLSALGEKDLKLRDSLLALAWLINEAELEYRPPGATAWTTSSTGRRHFEQCVQANAIWGAQ
jgi:hypothetical protein